ncbi:MAG: hypothetical protein WAM14_11185, partial [Candidatus Nitrosopolaris sp.]
RKVIRRNHIHILRQLEKAAYGSHYIVVYPDIVTLRESYSAYAKAHIVENVIFIAARAAVKQPIVADLISIYKPPILIGGS